MGEPWGYPWLEPDCTSANPALSHPLILTLRVSLLHAPLRVAWTGPRSAD